MMSSQLFLQVSRSMPKVVPCYFGKGFVCPETDRVAVLVADFARSNLNGVVKSYWYSNKCKEFESSPWRSVDAVMEHSEHGMYEVFFSDGNSLVVGPLMTLFVERKHVAYLSGYTD